MPVTMARRGGKFRVIEAGTNAIATNKAGTAVDGGGHKDSKKAARQVRAINQSLRKKTK